MQGTEICQHQYELGEGLSSRGEPSGVHILISALWDLEQKPQLCPRLLSYGTCNVSDGLLHSKRNKKQKDMYFLSSPFAAHLSQWL